MNTSKRMGQGILVPLINKIENEQSIELILTNGITCTGKISEIKSDYVIIDTDDGLFCVSSDMIGAWELFYETPELKLEYKSASETKTKSTQLTEETSEDVEHYEPRDVSPEPVKSESIIKETEQVTQEPVPEVPKDEVIEEIPSAEIVEESSESISEPVEEEPEQIPKSQVELEEPIPVSTEQEISVEETTTEILVSGSPELESFDISNQPYEIGLKDIITSFPITYDNDGDIRKAKKDWDMVVNRFHNEKGKAVESSLELMDNLINQYPHISALYYNAGCCAVRLGDYKSATKYFEDGYIRTSEYSIDCLHNAIYCAYIGNMSSRAYSYLITYFNDVRPTNAPKLWEMFVDISVRMGFKDVLLTVSKNIIRQVDDKDKSTKEMFVLISSSIDTFVNGENLEVLNALKPKIRRKSVRKTRDELIEIIENAIENPLTPEGYDFYKYASQLLESRSDENIVKSESLESVDILNEINIVPEHTPVHRINETCRIHPDMYQNRTIGEMYRYVNDKGFGFIRDLDNNEYFFHISQVFDEALDENKLRSVGQWDYTLSVVFTPEVTEEPNGDEKRVAKHIVNGDTVTELYSIGEKLIENEYYGPAIRTIEYVELLDSTFPYSPGVIDQTRDQIQDLISEQMDQGADYSYMLSLDFYKHLATGIVYTRQTMYKEAIGELELALDEIPSDRSKDMNSEYLDVLRYYGYAAFQNGDYDTVIYAIHRMFEVDETYYVASIMKSAVMVEFGYTENALLVINDVLDKHDDPWAHYVKGYTLTRLHRPKEGLVECDLAYKQLSHIPSVIGCKAFTLSVMGRFEEAISEYQNILKLRPDDFDTQTNLMEMYKKMERYDDALGICNKLIQMFPLCAQYLSHKGAILSKMGQHDHGLKFIDKAIELAPTDGKILFAKGYILSKQGKDRESLKYFEQSLEQNPRDYKALSKKSFVLSKIGKYDEALDTITTLIRYRINDPKLWYYRGLIETNKGDYTSALESFKRSLSIKEMPNTLSMIEKTCDHLGLDSDDIISSVRDHDHMNVLSGNNLGTQSSHIKI
jgi:tetratricopeptide (TPR) repeat protein